MIDGVEITYRTEGQVGIIGFPRDVTAQTREAAYNAYNQLARAKVSVVGFNFAASDYVNSAGIGLIISLVEDASMAGRRAYGYGLSAHYRKLFNMVGLRDQMILVDDEAAMLAELSSPEN
ncbi:STAS domain-containing protein [Chloroflexota bacterium]